MVNKNKELTRAERDELRKQKTVINGVFVAVKKQLMIVQHELVNLTGKPIQEEHLNVSKINVKTGEFVIVEAKVRILKFVKFSALFK